MKKSFFSFYISNKEIVTFKPSKAFDGFYEMYDSLMNYERKRSNKHK
jgi:hypothetical protein